MILIAKFGLQSIAFYVYLCFLLSLTESIDFSFVNETFDFIYCLFCSLGFWKSLSISLWLYYRHTKTHLRQLTQSMHQWYLQLLNLKEGSWRKTSPAKNNFETPYFSSLSTIYWKRIECFWGIISTWIIFETTHNYFEISVSTHF